MSNTPEILFNYLSNIFYFKPQDPIDISKIDKEYADLAEGLMFLEESMREYNEYAMSLSRGDLNIKIPHGSNEIASALKSLHASLLHVTWQSQQVAQGDYKQRVDFMGEFANAFNKMVEQLHERQKKLEAHAYIDDMTDLYNRRYGMLRFNEWLNNKKAFILIFVDLDCLKYINDEFGHEEGDNYIIKVADYLKKYANDSVICRLGGDEFMILKPDTGYDAAKEFMDDLADKICSDEFLANKQYTYSISYGVVEIKEDNTLSASVILSNADDKMYEHKRARKKSRLSAS